MREKRIRSEVAGYREFAEYRREREREGGRERERMEIGMIDGRWRMGLNGVRVGIRRTIRNSE